MRVGELTRLNISDMNFQERSCIVLGKGNGEREVYFSAKSKMYIEKYLETRTDDNEALFVSLIKPYNRLGIYNIKLTKNIDIVIILLYNTNNSFQKDARCLVLNNIENLKDLIIYQSQNNENISVEVLYNEEDFWLTQKSMSKLFNVAENNITYHLQNIFKTKELDQDSVTQKIRVTASDGKKYNTNFYSLDAIIAVGYRVNSKEATDFRIWATKTLKEYIKKGFIVNSEMLKNGPKFGKDYFDELLVKIKEIRASERRFYQKITDIYKECSYDYDKNSETTQEFYKNVQNKLHFAITGMTAPEIIYNRVDSKKDNMGLTTWKNAPDGKILETDVTIAKNYLSQEEIIELNNLVSMYLDYAERQVKLGKIISMQEWKEKLEVFLKINEYNILKDNGKIKREIADKLALDEYKKYRIIQDKNYISDFDELVTETKNLNSN